MIPNYYSLAKKNITKRKLEFLFFITFFFKFTFPNTLVLSNYYSFVKISGFQINTTLIFLPPYPQNLYFCPNFYKNYNFIFSVIFWIFSLIFLQNCYKFNSRITFLVLNTNPSTDLKLVEICSSYRVNVFPNIMDQYEFYG